MNVINQAAGKNFTAYNADCVDVVSALPDNSIGMSVFSPPFASLYTYSDSTHDMGNVKDDSEFFEQFDFLVAQLYRVIKPGRIVAFHCMNLPTTKERDGYIGMKDFRGDLIRAFQKYGFIFHSETCIWKDPLIAATRTKAIGLMHKQLCKDSAVSRCGIPDYLVAMKKPGENPEPVVHENGLTDFIGENPPRTGVLSHQIWRRYASPVWMDIDPSKTLQGISAREEDDERHICPLQLQVIDRALVLWSNPCDVVLSPFMGIGSDGYESLKMNRKFIGVELKTSCYDLAVRNLHDAENELEENDLFGGEE
jgi:DNA modification methylase